MADKTYFLPDVGPLLTVPEYVSYSALSSSWRNIGLSGEARSAEPGGYVAINENIKHVDWQGRPWTVADNEGVYHDLCGLHLYAPSEDPEEEPVYTGKDIVWQFRVHEIGRQDTKIVWYNIDQRMIIRTEAGVIVQSLSFVRTGMGYNHSGTKNLSIGYTAIDTEYNDEHFFGFGIVCNYEHSSEPFKRYIGGAICAISDHWLETNEYVTEVAETDDPNAGDPDGPSRPGGGDGTHSRKNEDVSLPDLPDLGALDAGMITLYRMTATEMSSFTAELWTFWQGIKSFFADPLDFVVGCMILPFTPNSSRSAYPKFGADTWSTAFDVISEQYYSISCGSIDIDKYYDSCFDFDPYQKIQIWIPFVGYRDLPVDQIVGKTIELTYHIDCMTGDFVAFVHTPAVGEWGPQLTQIICQFSGTMGTRVPLSRQSFDAAVQAGIQLIGGAVGMAAGGIAMAAGLDGSELNADQIANQASAATVSAINAGKTRVIRSGSIGAASGLMAKLNPFIIRTLPRQSLPDKYKELEGYPSNIYGLVGNFSGFLAVEKIMLETTATETEKEMIMQLLKGGIYV